MDYNFTDFIKVSNHSVEVKSTHVATDFLIQFGRANILFLYLIAKGIRFINWIEEKLLFLIRASFILF